MAQVSFYNKFTLYGYDSYIKSFQNYYKKFPKHYMKNLHDLKNGLDDVSIHNVDFFLNLILSLPLPSSDFLIKKSRILDPRYYQDLANEKVFLNKLNVYKSQLNYVLQGYEKFELNVFKYHCGLKFIPNINLKDSVFIDVGAFWGDSALMLLKYQPAKIVCFEPNKINFQLLTTTMKNNNISNWVINNLGVYNKNTKGIINYISNNQNHGASFIFKPYKNNKTHAVDLVYLDDYMLNHMGNLINNHPIGLLKIDAEGAGYQVLYGAKTIIAQFKPIISCAIYHNPIELFKIKSFLLRLNPEYNIKIVNLNNDFILKELTLLAY